MSISDKNQPRFVLVVILLVFGSIMAYSLNVESKPKIDVEEGHEEIDLEYVKSGESEGFYNLTTDTSTKNATSVTYVDGKNNTLEFKVLALHIIAISNEHRILLKLNVEGDFKQKYEPEELLLKMWGLNGKNNSRNGQNFLKSYLREENLKEWPAEKSNEGSRGSNQAFLGFEVKENDFSGKVRLRWDIPKSNWDNNYTLRVQSVVKGMSQDVTATVDINIQEVVKA